MNHLKTGNAFYGQGSYKNYKYNGKELQETGMYMADLGRWGVIDPRSQYTHEAYSYVWNNPISFNDPSGMQGELAYPDRDGRKEMENFGKIQMESFIGMQKRVFGKILILEVP